MEKKLFIKARLKQKIKNIQETLLKYYMRNRKMKAYIELLEILAEAEDDVKNGRIAPAIETFDALRKVLAS